jgi:hypothetical protein
MLSEPAQALMREVFGQDGLFRGLPQIRKRIVAWGPNAAPVELNHSAIMVSEEALLDSLGEAPPAADAETGWSVFASQPLPASSAEHRFGSRMASAMKVALKATCEAEACWIESVERGWLFLIANGPGFGWLLSVGADPGELLGQSRLIRQQVAAWQPSQARFAASPRIMAPLGETGWIACGTAAMAFDPLCGDGAANAVREAILAAAVIGAVARGGEPAPLLAHYEARLTAGFRRHLAHCLQYYESGGNGPWWQAEAASARKGMEWCAQRLSGHTEFRYKLNGFELQAIG